MFLSIDHLVFHCAAPDVAIEPWTRAGLPTRIGDRGASAWIGDGWTSVRIDFQAHAEPHGFRFIGIRVQGIDAVRSRLAASGVDSREADGTVQLDTFESAGCRIRLVEASADVEPAPATTNPWQIRRLDHLAIVTHDLSMVTSFWNDVLDVRTAGQVNAPAMVIRQLAIGDAMMELLGENGPDSPIRKRPAGLVGMMSWETADLAETVAQARRAGFEVPEPADGLLPGTRICTIPAAQTGGLNWQLLQYV